MPGHANQKNNKVQTDLSFWQNIIPWCSLAVNVVYLFKIAKFSHDFIFLSFLKLKCNNIIMNCRRRIYNSTIEYAL